MTPAKQAERSLELLSVVSPMFNEVETAQSFYDRVVAALVDVPLEIVLVNDGSRDGTGELLDTLAEQDERVKVIHLSRNFGHQPAITAGLDHARGDAVVMIDSDLQDPPEVIPEMIDAWRAGHDLAYGVRRARAGEGRFKLATAHYFYKLFSRLTRVPLQPNSGDFRLVDRQALDALLSMRERNRFLRGMSVWIGFDQVDIPYERDARAAGETKYTLNKMVRFSLDAISSFSYVPLQLATLLGFVFSIAAFVGIPIAIIARFADVYVPGITSTIVVILLLGGVQLITLGVIGEYLGRIYDEVKGRPLYVIQSGRNLDEDELKRLSP